MRVASLLYAKIGFINRYGVVILFLTSELRILSSKFHKTRMVFVRKGIRDDRFLFCLNRKSASKASG